MKDQGVRVKRDARCKYSITFKKKVVQEYARGELTQAQIRSKYGIGGKSAILLWSKKYGNLRYRAKITMAKAAKNSDQKRIKTLERLLKEAQLKVMAWETLIEVIKEEDGIDLLKKGAAKQSLSLPKPTGDE